MIVLVLNTMIILICYTAKSTLPIPPMDYAESSTTVAPWNIGCVLLTFSY